MMQSVAERALNGSMCLAGVRLAPAPSDLFRRGRARHTDSLNRTRRDQIGEAGGLLSRRTARQCTCQAGVGAVAGADGVDWTTDSYGRNQHCLLTGRRDPDALIA